MVYILLVILQHCETQATPTTNYVFFFGGKRIEANWTIFIQSPFYSLKNLSLYRKHFVTFERNDFMECLYKDICIIF